MESRFQEVSLPWVFAIEKFEERYNERLINIPLRNIGIEVGTLHEAQEEFVDDLKMGPGELQNRFVFLRVESIASRVYLGRY